MSGRWWTDEDVRAVNAYARDINDLGLGVNFPDRFLARLAPTVERIRREAKAEALRAAADAYLTEYGTWGGASQGKWLRDRADLIEAGDE